jgi:hypothetical protein
VRTSDGAGWCAAGRQEALLFTVSFAQLMDLLVYKTFVPGLEGAISKYSIGKFSDIGCGDKLHESIVISCVDEYRLLSQRYVSQQVKN